jgi:hypothetical protein
LLKRLGLKTFVNIDYQHQQYSSRKVIGLMQDRPQHH